MAPLIHQPWAAELFRVSAELEELEMEPGKMELIESVFAGDSEMARRMRALDWSATPLGPVEQWPQALRTSVRMVLDSARAFEEVRQPEIEKLRASEERLAEMSRLYHELQRTNEELQLEAGLLQQLPVSAWTLKPDGTPDFVNRVWLEFAGQTIEYVRSNPEAWMNAVHPEDREIGAKAFWEGVSSGRGFAIETRSLRAQDGVYRWHLNQAVPLRDADGKVLKFVGTTTDIDDQKRSEEALAVLDRAKTAFFSNVSHEFRTPLTLMLGLLEEVLAHERIEPEDREGLLTVRRNGLRLLKLVNTLLDFSRMEAGRAQTSYQPTDLASMKDVEGTREMVIQSQRAEHAQILVSVSDTGPGFPPELAEQIFNPFFTTKPHGTGMGLRISRSIIETHGGRLWADSSPGRGATFHFNLPAAIPST